MTAPRWLLPGLGVVAAGAAIVVAAWLGGSERQEPQRCPSGLISQGAGRRCCAPGQSLEQRRCVGVPQSCPQPLDQRSAGCVAPISRVRIPPGMLTLGPNDWEAQGVVAERKVAVDEPFFLDAFEVTIARWNDCVGAGACAGARDDEPGMPIRDIDPEQAERFCAHVGGRLPRGNEWLLAAAGHQARRYPWGPTGLVCRRAVFGRVAGPCTQEGELAGPELAGSVPAGATPLGLYDMAGNVAEWTVEPKDRHLARGGSYRSKVAAELKSWAVTSARAKTSPEVGFRCAYDR